MPQRKVRLSKTCQELKQNNCIPNVNDLQPEKDSLSFRCQELPHDNDRLSPRCQELAEGNGCLSSGSKELPHDNVGLSSHSQELPQENDLLSTCCSDLIQTSIFRQSNLDGTVTLLNNHNPHSHCFVNEQSWLQQNSEIKTTNNAQLKMKQIRPRPPKWRRSHRNHTRDDGWYTVPDYEAWYAEREAARRAERAEIQYDVYVPGPKDCDLAYSEKYQRREGIGHFERFLSDEERRCIRNKRKRTSNRPGSKPRHQLAQSIVLAMKEYDSEQGGEEYDDTEWEGADENEMECTKPEESVNLTDLDEPRVRQDTLELKLTNLLENHKKQAFKIKLKRAKRKLYHTESSQKKKQTILLTPNPPTNDQTNQTNYANTLDPVLFEPFQGPICITLPVAEFKPIYLKAKFCESYMEGQTYPRSFLIEISSHLLQRLRQEKEFVSVYTRLDLEAYLSFMEVKEKGHEILVNVALTGIFEQIQGTYLYTVRGSRTMDDVIERTMDYIVAHCDLKNFKTLDRPSYKLSASNPVRKKYARMELVASQLQPKSIQITPSKEVYHKSFIPEHSMNDSEDRKLLRKDYSADIVTKGEEDIVTTGEDIVTKGEDILTKGENIVTEGEDIVTKGEGILTKGEDIVTKSEDIVTKGEDIVTKGVGILTTGEDIVTKGEDIVTIGEDIVSATHGTSSTTHNANLNDTGFTLLQPSLPPSPNEAFYCSICAFNHAFLCEESETLKIVQVQALSSCGHWFCSCCWRIHIATRILGGANKILCPEFGCDTVLDPSMILMNVGAKLHRQYRLQYLEQLLEDHSETIRCSNPRCDMLITSSGITKVRYSPVTCVCGWMFCLGCRQDIHWPLSCSQAQSQHNRVSIHDPDILPQDDDIAADTRVTVYVKPCPYCNHPWEKTSGCNHVYCTCCSQFFCWGCGQKDNDPAINHNRCYLSTGMRHGTAAIILYHIGNAPIKDVPRRRTRLYTLAVHHRKERSPQRMDWYRRQSSMWLQLTWTYRSSSQMHSAGGFDEWKRYHQTSVANTITIIYQLHYLIEHVAVLFETSGFKSREGGVNSGTLQRLRFFTTRLESILHLDPQNLSLVDASTHVQKLIEYTTNAEGLIGNTVLSLRDKLKQRFNNN